jgi:hypothetical protein
LSSIDKASNLSASSFVINLQFSRVSTLPAKAVFNPSISSIANEFNNNLPSVLTVNLFSSTDLIKSVKFAS